MKKQLNETEQILECVRSGLIEYGAGKKSVTAVSLCVEEILSRYAEKLTPETSVYFDVCRDARELSVILRVPGPDIPESDTEAPVDILKNTVEYMGFKLFHAYESEVNTDRLTVHKYFSILDNLKFTYRYMGKGRKSLYLGLFTHLLSALAGLIIPYMTGLLVVAYSENVLTQVIAVAVAITVSRCVQEVSFKLTNILYSKGSYIMQRAVRRKMVEELFQVQNEKIEKTGSGPFITMINDDISIISNGLCGVANYLSEAVYYVGVFGAIFLMDRIAFLMSLILLAVLLFLEKRRYYYSDIDKRKVLFSRDRTSGLVHDMVNGVKEVKNMHAENTLTERFAASDAQMMSGTEHWNTRTKIRSAANSVVMYLGYLLVMLYLGQALSVHRMEPAGALVLFNYFTIIGMPAIALIQQVIDFKQGYSLACERVRGFLEGTEYPRENFGKVHSEKVGGDVCFHNVSFIYNYHNPMVQDVPVLKDISFTAHPGEKVALVGKSGSGKSTALKLITRQLDCTGGEVTLDGRNVEEYDRDTLRGNVAVVSQSPHIFSGTIKENLLFAVPEASMEEIREVCRKASILDDILEMPQQFDTELGERGVRLSGGQAQRLAIARALLRKTPVLILDEATSALDNVTQKNVMESITENRQTVIMIAHRLSSIKDADRIAVLSDGRIIAEGTHEELLSTCAEYRNLYQSEK